MPLIKDGNEEGTGAKAHQAVNHTIGMEQRTLIVISRYISIDISRHQSYTRTNTAMMKELWQKYTKM